MSEENKSTKSERSEDELDYSETTTSTSERIEKKQSKSAGLKSKLSSTVRRDNSNGSVSELSDPTESIEPIVEPVIGVCQLKYEFYRDLRTLVPPSYDGGERTAARSVDGMLREMHDAIDEINRKFDDINLPLLISGCNNSIGGPETSCDVDDLLDCAKSPLRVARPKPDSEIEMKNYRLNNNLHMTVSDIVNRCEQL